MTTTHCRIILAALLIFSFLLPAGTLLAEPGDFAVIGDTTIGRSDTVFKTFLRTLDRERVTDFILVGNAIEKPGSEEELKQLLALTGPDKNIHIAPGNHDFFNFKSYKSYRKIIDKAPYHSFSIDDAQFIILCAVLPDEMNQITGEQLTWLREELKKPFKYRFVFIHTPLFPSPYGQEYGLSKRKEERDALHQLFVENKVNIVFSGHEHLYHRGEKDGVIYIITGGGGARLLTSREEYGGYFHYILAKKRQEGYVVTVSDLTTDSRKDEFFLK